MNTLLCQLFGALRSQKRRLSLRPLRLARSSSMSPGVRRFVPGRSIVGGRSCATPVTDFPKSSLRRWTTAATIVPHWTRRQRSRSSLPARRGCAFRSRRRPNWPQRWSGRCAPMIPIRSGVRVWIATGHTDMRRGMNGLALQVQEGLRRDPHAGDLFVFRGRRGDLIKILWHDGLGMSLYAKRLERGRFIWPSPADGVVAITAAQLGYMLEGIDWRNPLHSWRPHAVG